MYLESLEIENYRKFRNENNLVRFVEPSNITTTQQNVDNPKSVIGPSTTLIIGKNNAGKTTIANALKLIHENRQPRSTDFNNNYLSELHDQYLTTDDVNISLPELAFTIKVVVDMDKNDLMSGLIEFAHTQARTDGLNSILIKIRIEITEASVYKDAIIKLVEYSKRHSLSRNESIQLFYELLDQSSDFLNQDSEKKLFTIKYYNSNGHEAKKFSLKELINLREIKANRHLKDGVLSEVFNKIIKFQFDNDLTNKGILKTEVSGINQVLTEKIKTKSDNVSSVLTQIEDKNHVDLNLSGNVTYDKVVKELIKYNFSDNGDYIPESQFGLGYINLLNIIGEIIYYVDSYKKDSQNSSINLLFIEEPEAFMHPQMQEFFINRIDNAVQKALEISKGSDEDSKILNCQIAITTHSSHIVNSKIHSSNSFNNINYLNIIDKSANVINLNDDVISADLDDSKDLKFIKKHIKYKVSELFFADAIIFVEGATEETLLQFYIDKDPILKNSYISIFNINGAHGKVYFPLAKKLKIPCLIITDLDIKRSPCQKNKPHNISDDDCIICGHKKDIADTPEIKEKISYSQIKDLDGFQTTNATIKFFMSKKPSVSTEKDLKNIDYINDENIFVVFQKDIINDYYATSLEEAFILENFNNSILNSALESCKPRTYHQIVKAKSTKNFEALKHRSFEIQRALSDSKSEFSGELLYQSIISDDNSYPTLPRYILDGFAWVKNKLSE